MSSFALEWEPFSSFIGIYSMHFVEEHTHKLCWLHRPHLTKHAKSLFFPLLRASRTL